MKGKYKRKLIYCSSCDGDLVPIGCKCGTCGKREYASKIKKPNMMKQGIDEFV